MLSPAIQAEIDARTEEFRALLTTHFLAGRSITYGLQISISECRRAKLYYQAPMRHVAEELKELLDGAGDVEHNSGV